MRRPSLSTILTFLAFALGEVDAQSPREQLGKLPVCAQACITSAFASCKCRILDFTCACTCNAFRSFSESCTNTSCAESYLKPVTDALDGWCAIALPLSSSIPISSPAPITSSLASSTDTAALSATPTTSLDLSVVKPSDVLNTGVPIEYSSAEVPMDTGAPGYAPTITSSVAAYPSIPEQTHTAFDESRGPGITPTNPLLANTTTMSRYTYSSCYISSNETARGWNGTAVCMTFPGPMFTGGVAASQVFHPPWSVLSVLSILGWLMA